MRDLLETLFEDTDWDVSGEDVLVGRAKRFNDLYGGWRGAQIALTASEIQSFMRDGPMTMFWEEIARRIVSLEPNVAREAENELRARMDHMIAGVEGAIRNDATQFDWQNSAEIQARGEWLADQYGRRQAVHIASRQADLAKLLDQPSIDQWWRSVTRYLLATSPRASAESSKVEA